MASPAYGSRALSPHALQPSTWMLPPAEGVASKGSIEGPVPPSSYRGDAPCPSKQTNLSDFIFSVFESIFGRPPGQFEKPTIPLPNRPNTITFGPKAPTCFKELCANRFGLRTACFFQKPTNLLSKAKKTFKIARKSSKYPEYRVEYRQNNQKIFKIARKHSRKRENRQDCIKIVKNAKNSAELHQNLQLHTKNEEI